MPLPGMPYLRGRALMQEEPAVALQGSLSEAAHYYSPVVAHILLDTTISSFLFRVASYSVVDGIGGWH